MREETSLSPNIQCSLKWIQHDFSLVTHQSVGSSQFRTMNCIQCSPSPVRLVVLVRLIGRFLYTGIFLHRYLFTYKHPFVYASFAYSHLFSYASFCIGSFCIYNVYYTSFFICILLYMHPFAQVSFAYASFAYRHLFTSFTSFSNIFNRFR